MCFIILWQKQMLLAILNLIPSIIFTGWKKLFAHPKVKIVWTHTSVLWWWKTCGTFLYSWSRPDGEGIDDDNDALWQTSPFELDCAFSLLSCCFNAFKFSESYSFAIIWMNRLQSLRFSRFFLFRMNTKEG